MGARFDRLRCEVFQNLFLSPMNTGFVRPAVATVLTACGIETSIIWSGSSLKRLLKLQQYLPLAVLKLSVATSQPSFIFVLQQYLPLAVLKLFNIAA